MPIEGGPAVAVALNAYRGRLSGVISGRGSDVECSVRTAMLRAQRQTEETVAATFPAPSGSMEEGLTMSAHPELGGVVCDPFTVRRKLWKGGTQVLMASGAVVVALAVMVLCMDGRVTGSAAFSLGVGIALCAVAAGWALRSRGPAWRITLHEEGAVFQAGRREMACAFADLAAVGQSAEEHFSNGKFSGMTRRVRLWRREDRVESPSVDLEAYCKADAPEDGLLDGLTIVVIGKVAERIEGLLEEGRTARAPGLELRPNEIQIDECTVSLHDIAATGFHEGKLCIWLAGDERPRFRLDATKPNIIPMVEVVNGRISGDAEGDGSGALGRILFERRSSRVAAWVLAVLGIATVWLGIGLLLLLISVWLFRKTFRCHRHGVYQRGLAKEKRLLYRDVASFTYSATRQYVNGVYTGTRVSMKLVPEETNDSPTVSFSSWVRNLDRDLDDLRDRVSGVVGRKMLASIETGVEAKWTTDAVLGPEEIRFRKPRLVGKREWISLPYSQIAGSATQEGTFHLFAEGVEKPVMRLQVRAENFFPGLVALGHILSPDEESQREGEGAEVPTPDVDVEAE